MKGKLVQESVLTDNGRINWPVRVPLWYGVKLRCTVHVSCV